MSVALCTPWLPPRQNMTLLDPVAKAWALPVQLLSQCKDNLTIQNWFETKGILPFLSAASGCEMEEHNMPVVHERSSPGPVLVPPTR